jgi:hypothetical protein
MLKRNIELDDYVISETGNWNVAADYSKFKIMKPLLYADIYADIAYFGSSDLFEELNLNLPNYDLLKFKGFERLVRCLLTLIGNSYFAIKYNTDREILKNYKNELIKIENIKNKLIETRTDQVTQQEHFLLIMPDYERVLNIVLKIKDEINSPLNKSNLIFTDKEEFDPKKFKEAIKERMANKG